MTLVEQRPETDQQSLNITVETHNRRSLGKTIGVVGASALLALGVYELGHIGGLFPDINIENPIAGLGNHPPKDNASVMASTAEVESIFQVHCEGRIGVGVINHGNKDELMGGGEFDKIIFGDYLPCGDPIPVSAHLIRDPETGVVKKILATTNGLQVTQPRVDATDFRNCVATRPGDSKKEIDKKIADWKIANKKHEQGHGDDPGCDNGFSISGAWVVGGDASKLINTANTATQIAIATWVAPRAIMGGMNKSFKNDLKTELEHDYPKAKVQVELTTKAKRVEEQTAKVLKDLKDNNYKVKTDEYKGKPALDVKGPGGGEIRVTVDDEVIQALRITSIQAEVGEKPTKTAKSHK